MRIVAFMTARRFHKRFLAPLLQICCLAATFCASTPRDAQAEEITIFAAASLREAVGLVAQRFEADTGHAVTLVFGASSTVARQVARGAPADVILVADEEWAGWLESENVVREMQPFAGNRLVLVAQAGAPALTGETLGPALTGTTLAMAQVEAVPAGRYGRAALLAMGLWAGLDHHVVQAANVRAALRFVERGEAGFGIGYASDLIALPALVAVYEFDADSHPPIVYSGAGITAQGQGFMDYLQSDIGQSALAAWGFGPAPEGP